MTNLVALTLLAMLAYFNFKLLPSAHPFLNVLLLAWVTLHLSGCGAESKSNSILDAETELEATSNQLETLPGVRVISIEYLDSTKEALADLQPTEGMPFRLSGIAELEITEDLTETVDASRHVERKVLDEIRAAIQGYQLNSSPTDRFIEAPRAYVTQHRKGDSLSVGWRREVDFFQNPQSGKLAANVKNVQLVSGDEYFQGTQASTQGVNVDSEEGVKELNRRYESYLRALEAEGQQRLNRGIEQLSARLTPDAIFTDGENYYLLKTPDELGKFVTPENFQDQPVVPFEITWIDQGGNALATFDMQFTVSGLHRQMSGAYVLNLFNKKAEAQEQFPLFEVPKLLRSGIWGGKLSMHSTGERYHLVQVDHELEFVCWANELDQHNLSNSELVDNFQKLTTAQAFVESHPILCQFTYRDEPYSMVMRIKREPNSDSGTIVTTNLATGVATEWKLDGLRYIRSNKNIMYKADRVGDRIPRAHRFDGDNDLRFHLYPDGRIEFYGFKDSKTTKFQP